jgi:hypothetical protein
MWKRTAAVTAGALVVAWFLIAHGNANPPTRREPITYADLVNRPVLGRLGQPLGQIVTIQGVFADGTFTRMKKDDGWILVRVQVVNGQRLEHEQVFQYERAAKNSPAVGSAFKFIGYETGGFTGEPAGVWELTDPRYTVATTGYGFTTSFMFLRDQRSR